METHVTEQRLILQLSNEDQIAYLQTKIILLEMKIGMLEQMQGDPPRAPQYHQNEGGVSQENEELLNKLPPLYREYWNLRLQGYEDLEIARKLRLSYCQINNRRKNMKIYLKRIESGKKVYGRRFSTEEIDKLIEMHKAGKSTAEIAETIDRTKSVVNLVLDKLKKSGRI